MYSYTKPKQNNDSNGYAIKFIWLGLFSVLILHNIMPIVGRAISDYLTTYFLLGVVALSLFYFVAWRLGNWLYELLALLIITVISLYSTIKLQGDIVVSVYGALLGFTPVLIAYRFRDLPFKQQNLIYKITIAAFLITVVTSVVGLVSNPGAARYLATISDASDVDNIRYEWMNIGGFTFTYMLLTIYPAVICYMKETNAAIWKRVLLIVLLAAFYLSAEYMTGLMGFIIISTLWLMPKDFSAKKMLGILALLIFAFLILKSPLAHLFYNLSGSTSSTTLSERFLYMADSLSGVDSDSDVGLRKKLIMASVNGFLDHPLLGNMIINGKFGGGHSYLLDFLCSYGIVGLVLQVLAYKSIHKIFYKRFENTSYYGYAVCSFITAIVLSTINTGNHWIELTLFIPMILNMIEPFYPREEAVR